MKIVWIDPGGTAGWATYERWMIPVSEFDPHGEQKWKEQWESGSIQPEAAPHHLELFHFLDGHRGKNVVFGCESYEISPQPLTEHYLAVEDIGVVKFFASLRSEYIVWQGAQFQSQKSTWSIPTMKKLGLWKPGPQNRHAMSATRHILHYLVHTLQRRDILMRLR